MRQSRLRRPREGRSRARRRIARGAIQFAGRAVRAAARNLRRGRDAGKHRQGRAPPLLRESRATSPRMRLRSSIVPIQLRGWVQVVRRSSFAVRLFWIRAGGSAAGAGQFAVEAEILAAERLGYVRDLAVVQAEVLDDLVDG